MQAWDLGLLHANAHVDPGYNLSLLGYWYIYHLLVAECRARGSLAVCEIRADVGQLLAFVNAADPDRRSIRISRWDAVEDGRKHDVLRSRGYGRCFDAASQDLSRAGIRGGYDAAIVLDALQGGKSPVSPIGDIASLIKTNGVLIGGVKAGSFALTRLRGIADRHRLVVEFLDGGCLLRRRGIVPASHRRRLQLMLRAGSLLPPLAGDIYWLMRKH